MDYEKNIPLEKYIDNLTKIRNVADKIILISSIKNFNKSSKSESKELFDNEIEYLEGLNLEKHFLSEESIISLFENKNFRNIYLYNRLPINIQKNIFRYLLERLNEINVIDIWIF